MRGSGLGSLSFTTQGRVHTVADTAVLQSPYLPGATHKTPNKGSTGLAPPLAPLHAQSSELSSI